MSTTDSQGEGWPELVRATKTIVVVDVVESVRLMQVDEADVIDRWRRLVHETRTQVLPIHRGRMVKSLGDGMLLEFESVHAGVAAALELQRRAPGFNIGHTADKALFLRIGVHSAEVLTDEFDVYGSGVNLAARLASVAEPGCIVGSADLCGQLLLGVDADLEDLGDIFFKHIAEPVHCYRLSHSHLEPTAAPVLHAPKDASAMTARLAVMPLQVLQASMGTQFAGDLVADGLIARLSVSPWLRVLSRLSTSALAGRQMSAQTLAERLGADYLLTGSIWPGDTRWRIGLELVTGSTGEILWAHSAEVDLAQLLRGDDEFSAEVVTALTSAISLYQLKRLTTQPWPSLQAYALQISGLTLMHRSSKTEFERARQVLELLVERHPRAVQPRAWLANWWVLNTTRGLSSHPREDASIALLHTRIALEADPDCAMALAMQGFVHCHLLGDLDTAEANLEQALKANPNEALAWLYRSVVHGFRGEGQQAFEATEMAISLSPLDPQRHYFDALAASAAVTAGHLQRGIEFAERALRVNRNHLPTLRALTVAHAEAGHLDAARQAAARVLELAPNFTIHTYVAGAPKGAEQTRQRFAEAFSLAGLPLG